MTVRATDPGTTGTPSRRPPRVDVVVGALALLLALALGLWLLPTYVRTPIAPRPLAMAPWFLPAVTTGMIALAGLMLIARGRRGGSAGDGAAAARHDARGLVAALAAVVLYPVLMPRLGALATGMLLTCGLLAIARVRRSQLAVVGLLVPLAAWALFAEAIGIPLPRGPWWGP